MNTTENPYESLSGFFSRGRFQHVEFLMTKDDVLAKYGAPTTEMNYHKRSKRKYSWRSYFGALECDWDEDLYVLRRNGISFWDNNCKSDQYFDFQGICGESTIDELRVFLDDHLVGYSKIIPSPIQEEYAHIELSSGCYVDLKKWGSENDPWTLYRSYSFVDCLVWTASSNQTTN